MGIPELIAGSPPLSRPQHHRGAGRRQREIAKSCVSTSIRNLLPDAGVCVGALNVEINWSPSPMY